MTAGAVLQFGGLINLFLFVPSYALRSGTPAGVIGLMGVSSPIAFNQGFKAIADAEFAKVRADPWFLLDSRHTSGIIVHACNRSVARVWGGHLDDAGFFTVDRSASVSTICVVLQ